MANLHGMKLFRYIGSNSNLDTYDEQEYDIVRIIKEYNSEKFKIKDEVSGNTAKVTKDQLKDYHFTMLDPVGVLTFSVVTVGKNQDVVVTLERMIDIAMGVSAPCVICRQSVTDFFYNIISNDPDHSYVGVSVSDQTCPSNIEYGDLLICDTIDYSEIVNLYYDDTIDSILECINQIKFNDVLRKLYDKHVDSTGNPMLKLREEDHGWCTTLKKLLQINNFWIDVDAAFNITDVDFDIKDYIIEKKDASDMTYMSFNEEATQFLRSTFQLNFTDTIVTEYWYDIDFSEYRNENYVLIRDKNSKLYLVVYTLDGQYIEQDIEAAKAKEDISHALGLAIYNKYTSK